MRNLANRLMAIGTWVMGAACVVCVVAIALFMVGQTDIALKVLVGTVVVGITGVGFMIAATALQELYRSR